LMAYDVPDPTFNFYGVRTFFPHNTRRSHKIGFSVGRYEFIVLAMNS
jgi:hypothetical protein